MSAKYLLLSKMLSKLWILNLPMMMTMKVIVVVVTPPLNVVVVLVVFVVNVVVNPPLKFRMSQLRCGRMMLK